MNRPAFSLIELAVCLVVLGLLGGLAAVSLRGVAANADATEIAEAVVALDEHMRRRAADHGRAFQLLIDLDRAALSVQTPAAMDEPTTPQTFRLPPGWSIRAATHGRGPDASHGTLRVPCSPDGETLTYGLRLRGPSERRVDVAILGLTGQPVYWTTADESGYQAIFDALTSVGHDAG